MNRTTASAVLIASQFCGVVLFASPRVQSFNDDWRFHRGDVAGAEDPAFDDADWRKLDVPHDWSLEDLPPLDNSVPELDAVTGDWRFKTGDEAVWKRPDFDDTGWDVVKLPAYWEAHSNYTEDNAFGWYRRKMDIPADMKGKDIMLLLGKVDDVDEVWLNGERIGGMGAFPPNYATAWEVERRYPVSASLIRGDGTDVLAVRVFDGTHGGGIFAAGVKNERVGPFDPRESPSKHFTGNTVGGIGWYRKEFTLEKNPQRLTVLFDGVYRNAELWINGHRLGEHPYGYTAFEFELTEHLKPAGQANVLAVKVRNEGRSTRWYSGSGIYRSVSLISTDDIYVPTWGVFVATPEVETNNATVSVSTELVNRRGLTVKAGVRTRVFDAAGQEVGDCKTVLNLDADSEGLAEQSLDVSRPHLWSLDTPTLYTAKVEIYVDGKVVDEATTSFGIRKIEFDTEHGFRLNGETVLLKGGCIHHDNGPLGAMAIERAEERKIELLLASGYNAIRTAHNPPSAALLEACDRLGMLVIDEAFDQWNEPKEHNLQDYHRFFNEWYAHDTASMVRRDRNHPSVIMWSIGNEIPEQFRAEQTQKKLREAVLAHDTTRPVTQGVCNYANEDSDPGFLHLDVAGYNYLPHQYESDHKRHPDRVMYGSESFPKDALAYWKHAEEKSYVIGDFVWTAMDYLGEAGLAHAVLNTEPNPFFMPWPWFNAWCGDLDLCGYKKPQSYYRDIVWRRSQIEMFAHEPIPEGLVEILSWWGWPKEYASWNWGGLEGKPLQVSVYSRCERVRLELNGKVVGEQPVSEATNLTARFFVPYAPGELIAFGLIDGKVVAETVLQTTGEASRIQLTADRSELRADRGDLSYVKVEIVDEQGRRIPDAAVDVKFSVSGVGELAAQGSADPKTPASFRVPERTTYEGRCLAILRPSGEKGSIQLTASAEGFEASTITINCK